jgi:multiple sugar transport system permease protein
LKTRRSCIMRNKTQSGRLARKAYLFLLPSLAGTAVFVLLPYVDVVRRSFFEAAGGRFVAMQNYVTVVGNSAFRLASFNTLRFLVICVPLLVLVSLFCSMLIAGLKEEGTVFKTSLLVPLAIPVASIVLLWKLFFHPQGMVNQITALFGMAGIDWINGDTAFGVLVFTYVWKNLGYDVVLWVAGLAAISDELYEAARVDGAGILARFLYVTLPGLSKTAFLVVSLSVFNSFKVFREAYLIAGEYPHESIYMLQHLFNHWFVTLDIQKMSAASVLLLLVVALPVITKGLASRRGET